MRCGFLCFILKRKFYLHNAEFEFEGEIRDSATSKYATGLTRVQTLHMKSFFSAGACVKSESSASDRAYPSCGCLPAANQKGRK